VKGEVQVKTATITISFDEEKLNALKLYLDQKDTKTEDELAKALEMLYTKTVPAGVREFIDMRSGVTPKASAPKQRKKISPSSAVGEAKPEPTENASSAQ